jgi:hypothetical protein
MMLAAKRPDPSTPACQNRVMSGLHGKGSIRVVARSFESLATDSTTLRFPAPLAERAANPAGFEFWWKMLEFVFELPDPARFPKLGMTPGGGDLAALRRYVTAAEEMAESDLLNAEDAFTVHVADGGAGIEHVDTTFTSNEVTRGFTTLFRQFDSGNEPASFLQAQRILREADLAAPDVRSSERLAQLKLWGRARGNLRAENLKVRVGQKLRAAGRWADGIPGEGTTSPETLISLYQYGELIHWRETGSILEPAADPFEYAMQRMAFLNAATGLTHVYLGFSLLVRAALGA